MQQCPNQEEIREKVLCVSALAVMIYTIRIRIMMRIMIRITIRVMIKITNTFIILCKIKPHMGLHFIILLYKTKLHVGLHLLYNIVYYSI